MADGDPPGETATGGQADGIALETGPIVWPVVAVMVTVTLLGLAIVILLVTDPDRVGGTEIAEILAYAVGILATVILLRYGYKLLVLRRTRYIVHDGGFKREYRLLFRRQVREIPIEQLRGEEFVQGRFQTLFGCATIRLLTGGTDYSLGFVEFESVANPSTVFETIRDMKDSADRRRVSA